MFVQMIADPSAGRPAVIVPNALGVDPPKLVGFAGRTVPVSLLHRDKFVTSSHAKLPSTSDVLCGVTESLRGALNLPLQGRMHCKVADDTWLFGPCLGIYIQTKSSQRPFGNQQQLLTDLALMANQAGVDLVALPPGFTKDKRGYRFDAKAKVWGKTTVPMPDIVLRRSGAFSPDCIRTAMKELAMFQSDGRLHTLPPTFSNKWNFYQRFSGRHQVASYLPKTQLASSPEDVYGAVSRRKDVYIKPLTGARGVSVFHIYQEGGRTYVEWEAAAGDRGSERLTRHRSFARESDFLGFWRDVRLKHCIVQDTVPLPHTKAGYPFDFRWLVQYADGPQIVARVARIGGKRSVTTNIHTGGRPMDALQLLEQESWRNREDFIRQMDAIAIRLAEDLTKAFGPYAELGIDLALTENGEIRIFEVNATPGRRMLRRLGDNARQMSLQYLLEYAIKAAGFSED